MNRHDEAALNILKYASKLKLQEPIAPVADTTALTGFCYPQLKEILGEFSSAGIMLLKELEDSGYLTGTFRDRVILCPSCLAYNIIFRDTCIECGSPNIETLQMIHHYRCGYVGSERDFLSDGMLVCPKCSQKLKHVGKDFEKPSEVYNCLDCNWSGSETATAGRCLACGAIIRQDDYIVYDIKSYIISQEGLLVSQTGEIRLKLNETEKLPTKEEIRNYPWSIISLLGVTNTLVLIAERYGMKLSVMSIFPDVVHEALLQSVSERMKIDKKLSARFFMDKKTVMDEKVSALVKVILEKIRNIIRACDYAAVSDQATIFILLPEISADQASIFAGRIIKEINGLSFSGIFKQTTLSIGISEWQKGFEAADLMYKSKAALETARSNGGNQIKAYTNEMVPD